MDRNCTKCSMETGITAKLSEDPRTGELVCTVNPKHRFKIGKSGFLESVPER
jgi:hypothetical protein